MTQLLWYIRRNGAVNGPFPAGQVREQLRTAELSGADEASLDGLSWVPLADCELFRDWLPTHPVRSELADAEVAARRDHEVTRQLVLAESRRRPPLRVGVAAALTILIIAGGVWLGQRPEAIIQPGLARVGDCASAPAPGVSWRACDRVGAGLAGVSLRGADLIQANLEGADLSSADLTHANLGLARLRGASLRRANLRGATLDGAILTEADLTQADLGYASLRGARLDAARLDGAKLAYATWPDGRVCAEGSVGTCR